MLPCALHFTVWSRFELIGSTPNGSSRPGLPIGSSGRPVLQAGFQLHSRLCLPISSQLVSSHRTQSFRRYKHEGQCNYDDYISHNRSIFRVHRNAWSNTHCDRNQNEVYNAMQQYTDSLKCTNTVQVALPRGPIVRSNEFTNSHMYGYQNRILPISTATECWICIVVVVVSRLSPAEGLAVQILVRQDYNGTCIIVHRRRLHHIELAYIMVRHTPYAGKGALVLSTELRIWVEAEQQLLMITSKAWSAGN